MNYPLTHQVYYENLKAGVLTGLKCKSCGSYTAPPKMTCLECSSKELEAANLSGRATLRTYTVIRVAPEGYEAPYAVAMAELDEGPWVMGMMDYAHIEQLGTHVIGAKVKIGHKVIPADLYSAGEGVTLIFSPVTAKS